VADIIAAGIIPGGLEMMDNLAIRAAEDFIHAGYPVDAAPSCCASSTAYRRAGRLRAGRRPAPGRRQRRAPGLRRSRARALLGRAQERLPGGGAHSPDYYCMDGTIPAANCRVLKGISELSAQYGLRVANVFHAGDGNMHPLILFDANLPGELERAEAIGGKILELCVAVGGSITGEHGVGARRSTRCAPVQQRRDDLFHG
jgi:glycolate oxidase